MLELLPTNTSGTIEKITKNGVYVRFGKSVIYLYFSKTFTLEGITEMLKTSSES